MAKKKTAPTRGKPAIKKGRLSAEEREERDEIKLREKTLRKAARGLLEKTTVAAQVPQPVISSPAAWMAAATGDIANAVVASMKGGVELQEAAGQRDFTRCATKLPIRGTISSPEKKQQWEAVGFVFGEPIPAGRIPLFVACLFPPGWSLKATDHSMWSNVVDDQGRPRASVFYKAAFYDTDAHTFGLSKRYVTDTDYVADINDPRRKKHSQRHITASSY